MNRQQAELFAEVDTLARHTIESAGHAEETWLVHQVVSAHEPGIEGPERDWALNCVYHHVQSTVRSVLHRYKPKEDAPDSQILLPGCERLQLAYLVKRDGRQQLVRTDLLTDSEIDQKCDELDAMAAGCLLHKAELRRYQSERKSAAE